MKLKKYQLLEKAMRDYPAGTKFKSAYDDKTEAISDGVFRFSGAFHNCINSISKNGCERYVFNGDKWAEITPSEPEKAGLLHGKCAIKVNNEREFKLLMEHYESKGWIALCGDKPSKVGYVPFTWSYGDNFGHAVEAFRKSEGKSVIPFADFAAEVGVKVPVFVMKSMDGVDLYEGDKYYRVGRCKADATGDFVVYKQERLQSCHFVCCYPETDKAFSTEELALKWIEEQNKQKEIVLRHNTVTITITKNGFNTIAKSDGRSFVYSKLDIEEIYAAYKSMQ